MAPGWRLEVAPLMATFVRLTRVTQRCLIAAVGLVSSEPRPPLPWGTEFTAEGCGRAGSGVEVDPDDGAAQPGILADHTNHDPFWRR